VAVVYSGEVAVTVVMEPMLTAAVAIHVVQAVTLVEPPVVVQPEFALLGTERSAANFASTCLAVYAGFDSKILLNTLQAPPMSTMVMNQLMFSTEMGLPTTLLGSSLGRWRTGVQALA